VWSVIQHRFTLNFNSGFAGERIIKMDVYLIDKFKKTRVNCCLHIVRLGTTIRVKFLNRLTSIFQQIVWATES